MDVPETAAGSSRQNAVSRIALPAQDEDIASLRRLIIAKMTYAIGRDPLVATDRDWFVATALAVRDRMVDRWLPATRADYTRNRKRVYYLSLEFLLGRLLLDSLNNLGLTEPMRAALAELGVDLDRLRTMEPDAALGNGGLGRLAACFMESMASLGIPAHGFGIRYNHGLFHQVIRDGWQHEYPENWLSFGNPWEFERPDINHNIGFGGTVERIPSADGPPRCVWHPQETVVAMAYDTPVVGWRGNHVNTLRLWSARAPDPLVLETFNRGDHVGALAARAQANAISQILYPSDETPAGQELRLRQEYFFTSASLQNLLYRHIRQYHTLTNLAEKCSIQLNDTHPSIAVPELMRLLVDVHGMGVGSGLADHRQHHLLHQPHPAAGGAGDLAGAADGAAAAAPHADHLRDQQAAPRCRWPAVPDAPPLSAVSLIDETGGRRVRMGTLAFLGSHKINGVSALHTELMRQTVFRAAAPAVPGPYRQQDQRHHLPPLAVHAPIRG